MMEQLMNTLAEGFDLPILEWIAENLRCSFLDFIMVPITQLGNAGIFWIAIALILLLIPKYRRIGLAMGIALLTGLLLCNIIMKPAIARIRPYDYELAHFGKTIALLIPAQHDFSFPSGHTLASFEAATVLFLHSKKIGAGALIVASLIAFSRLYLYVHYPTDVLFSVAMGIGIGFFGRFLAQKIPLPQKR